MLINNKKYTDLWKSDVPNKNKILFHNCSIFQMKRNVRQMAAYFLDPIDELYSKINIETVLASE